jgi:protein required for attachment to host cells
MMQKYIVAVVNSAKAKLFVLEPIEFPIDEPPPKLMAIDELSNSAQTLQGQDLWSSTKPGRNRGAAGQAHGYDDHRENHRVEFERRFAQEVANKLAEIFQSAEPQQFILVAEPHILGIMRSVLNSALPKNLKMSELAKDLCQLKPHELQEYLVAKDLLPA